MGNVNNSIYTNLQALIKACFNAIPQEDQDLLITFPDGRKMEWDPFLAHQCFAKGRISEKQFVQHCLTNTKKGGQS